MRPFRKIGVFLASPGDLREERDAFAEILRGLNERKAHACGYCFEDLRWEKVVPALGRPQEVINKYLVECDVFVMVMGARWGSPTGEFSSGTEEELFHVLKWIEKSGSPHLLMYFKTLSARNGSQQDPQVRRVLEFRKWIENNHICLYYEYKTALEWTETLKAHLGEWFDRKIESVPSRPIPNGSITKADFTHPQKPFELERLLSREIVIAEGWKEKAQEMALKVGRVAIELGNRGQLEAAEQCFINALGTVESPPLLNLYGVYLLQTGELERAEHKLVRAKESSRKHSSSWIMASCNLAKICILRGQLEHAITELQVALTVAQSIGRPSIAGRVHSNLCEAYLHRGNDREAMECLRRAAESYSESGNLLELGYLYTDLGVIHRRKGELEKASHQHRGALNAFRTAKDKEGEGVALANLGIVAELRDSYKESEELLNEALKIFETLGDKRRLASACGALGVVFAKQNMFLKAEKILRDSLKLEEQLQNKTGMAHDLFHLSLIEGALGELSCAHRSASKANQLYRELGDDDSAGICAKAAGGIHNLMAQNSATSGSVHWIGEKLKKLWK